MTKKKTAQAETVKQVVQWILEANSERNVREAIVAKFPGENAQAAIDAAVKEITATGRENVAFTRGWVLSATRELVRKMVEVGNFADALRGVKQVGQLTKEEE